MRWLAVGMAVLMAFVVAGYANAVDEMEAADAEMLQSQEVQDKAGRVADCVTNPSSSELGCPAKS
jgi:hypothetical protein